MSCVESVHIFFSSPTQPQTKNHIKMSILKTSGCIYLFRENATSINFMLTVFPFSEKTIATTVTREKAAIRIPFQIEFEHFSLNQDRTCIMEKVKCKKRSEAHK